MNRKFRIIGGCSIAAAWLALVPSCATAPGRGIPLEAARRSLQTEYPELLQSFDLHLGVFSVDEAAWDTLSSGGREHFLDRCSQSRREITGRKKIRIQAAGDVLATYDGANAVYYGGPAFAGSEQDVISSGGAEPAGSRPDSTSALLSIPHPIYPLEALKAGIEGTVVVQARFGSDGKVREVLLVDGGIEMLNGAALDAARKARFRPLSGGEEADSVWVRIPMHFSIRGVHKPAGQELNVPAGGFVNAVAPLETGRAASPTPRK